MARRPTVAEARAALTTLTEFVEGIHRQLSSLLGENETRLLGQVLPEKAPETWTDRVIQIIRESHAPLWPREVIQLYVSRKWPDWDEKSLGDRIRTGIHQAKTRGLIAPTPDGRYAMPSKQT